MRHRQAHLTACWQQLSPLPEHYSATSSLLKCAHLRGCGQPVVELEMPFVDRVEEMLHYHLTPWNERLKVGFNLDALLGKLMAGLHTCSANARRPHVHLSKASWSKRARLFLERSASITPDHRQLLYGSRERVREDTKVAGKILTQKHNLTCVICSRESIHSPFPSCTFNRARVFVSPSAQKP